MLWLTAIIAFIKALFGIKPKDTMLEVQKHDTWIAEKQASTLADHTAPDAADRLHDGTF